ncbi:MAG TPA: toll/interleukin-1 receptor domain-containing protein [Terrimicrobiaceae bacterium]
MPLSLEDQDWWTLLRSIQEGQCILFLGPGVAIDPLDPTGDPLPVRLARKLTEKLKQLGKGDQVIAPSDLAHVAQTYQREMRTRRAGLEFAATEFYKPYRDQTTPLHQDLAALPFNLCISTTPDHFLLNAFSKTPGKKPMYDFYHFQPDPKRPKEVQPPPPDSRPLVYGHYGSVDMPHSLVLSENDLLDFLVNVTRNSPPLNLYVASRLREPRASFLFMGFGFRHWYVRILLHVLKAHEPGMPSLALEGADFFSHPERQETALFFSKGHMIYFHDVPWTNFAADLRERFEKDAAASGPDLIASNEQLGPEAPVAFLCHENRDKPYAEQLGSQLQTYGIKIWLDKQSLRGGDRWPNLIGEVLEKHTDYVVVLQSPQMLDKPESYCFLEIDLALKRQPKFAPGVRYLIPAITEADPRLPLPNLGSTFHSIDLTAPGEIDALAQTILEDWKKRQTMKRAA